ncbi:MAG: peptide deformylase [Patescibacteria group bacterium]
MLPVLQSGDALLRTPSVSVPEELFGTQELTQMVEDMAETLHHEPDGVALAAPQVGLPYRIFIVRHDRMSETHEVGQDSEPILGVFINPKFIKTSRKRVEVPEGCLSVKNVYGTTIRYERALIEARTVDGTRFERGAGGILAQAFQHETDHLEGILFIDHAIDMHESHLPSTHEETA